MLPTPLPGRRRRRRAISYPLSGNAHRDEHSDNFSLLRFSVHPHPDIAAEPDQHADLELCFHNTFWEARTSCAHAEQQTPFAAVHFHTQDNVDVTTSREDHPPPQLPNYIVQCEPMHLWPREYSDLDSEPDVHQSDSKSSTNTTTGLITIPLFRVVVFALLGYFSLATLFSLSRLRYLNYFAHDMKTRHAHARLPPGVHVNMTVFDDYVALRRALAILPISWMNTSLVDFRLGSLPEFIAIRESRRLMQEVCEGLLRLGTDWNEEQGFHVPDWRVQGPFPDPWLPEENFRDQEGGTVDIYSYCSHLNHNMIHLEASLETAEVSSWQYWLGEAEYSLSLLDYRFKALERYYTRSGANIRMYHALQASYSVLALGYLNDSLSPVGFDGRLGNEEQKLQAMIVEQKHRLEESQRGVDATLMLFSHVQRELLEADHEIDTLSLLVERALRGTKTLDYIASSGIRRLARLSRDSALEEVQRQHLVAATIMSRRIAEQEEVRDGEDRVRGFILELLRYADAGYWRELREGTTIGGHWQRNPWSQRRPVKEQENGQQWCLYPDCPLHFNNESQEQQVMVYLAVPHIDDIIAKLSSARNEIQAVREIWVTEMKKKVPSTERG